MNDPAITASWVRNRADEAAVASGCWFNPAVGGYPVWWIERFCKLYEGEQAGEPMLLRGCHECEHAYGLELPDDWDEDGEAEAIAVERARRHAECVAQGHRIDWQYDFVMRLFGWQKDSQRWGRPIRRFRKASLYVPKKNKKSPTLAALGLYITCGDNEPGQKFYFGAKDGMQAREIAGKHAIEMVRSSPELDEACKVNLSLMQITHEASRSLMKPMSSANSQTQKAREGLNGSVGIDETHVVDREFIGRISRAGISRSEPLHIEVSTAGSDPESYGKEKFDAGQVSNDSGDPALTDEGLLFVCYAAPQDLSDADLAADPVKWGMLANPAWGHTVGEEEYLADYNASKTDLREFARFKMYRLNIWQQSAQPWLNVHQWAMCKRIFTEADLIGRDCYAAIDLAKTTDTTALALEFPEDDGTRKLLVKFWLPEATVARRSHLVKYKAWADAGWLIVTPGNTVDYMYIRKQLLAERDRFKICKLAYDDMYAAQLIQRLIEEDGFDSDVPVNFKQTIMDFAGPTAAFERRVIEGTIHHNGNQLLTWQAGNVNVKTDVNQNMRPVKQKHGDHRTIDGMVAAIMADEMATSHLVTIGEVEFW